MTDVNEEFLRQLGLHPGAAQPGPPATALSLEDWARGAAPLKLHPKPAPDPRATGATNTESRAVKERAIKKKGKEPDVNEELLLQLGLHPAAKKKSEIAPQEMFGPVAPELPAPVSEEQREQAERGRAYQSRQPRTSAQRVEQAAMAQGVPAQIFRRPPSDFEVRLGTQEKVQLVHPERGIPTERYAADAFTPLADPDTGAIIGYTKSGADSLIVDLEGNIVQWGDTPVTPSAVQPDDLILVGGALVKGGGRLLASGGAALLRSGVVRRVSGRVLMSLRRVAAAVMLGATRAAPIVGGELGPRAAITAVRPVVAGTVEELGSVTTRRALRPAAGEVVGEGGSRAATPALPPVAGATAISATKAPTTTLVGTSEPAFRRAAVRAIRADPNHPLRFLLDSAGNFKRTRGLTHAELADHSDLVQMGHIMSSKGGGQRVVLQDAWMNQIDNITVEHASKGGAYFEQREAVDIGGIGVERNTALMWEREGRIPPGTVAGAKKIQ